MSFLLDTHTLLWFINGDSQLPVKVRNKIKDIDQACFLSIASLWEITIKISLGKLILPISIQDLFHYIERNQIEIIPINVEHLQTLSKLPTHHSDPFDRLIVSQAISERLILLTADAKLKNYKVKISWK